MELLVVPVQEKDYPGSTILRQYPVGEGEFLVNQQPIVDYNRHSIEEKIGYVSQEHILFSKSIRENIALVKGASQEDLVEAVAQAAFCG